MAGSQIQDKNMIQNINPQKLLRKKTQKQITNKEPKKRSTRQFLKVIAPGTRFIGQYELLELVERGGMGVVYRARNRNDGSIVAIKEFVSGEDIPKEDAERFKHEIDTTMMLDHPNIIKIINFGISKSHNYWFAMEFVAGGDLLQWLEEKDPEINQVCKLLITIATAVQHAHDKGIIHRDLKPGNILMKDNGEPLVMDFGLAKDASFSAENITQNGIALGTYNYMPPEQALGNNNQIDTRSDIYSIGAILYQVLTGIPPFVGKNELDILTQIIECDPVPIFKINPDVPVSIQTITMKCLEKEKRHRYSSAQEVADELGRYLNGIPITAKPPCKLRMIKKCVRKNRSVITTLITLLVSIGIVFAFYVKNLKKQTTSGIYASSMDIKIDDTSLSLSITNKGDIDLESLLNLITNISTDANSKKISLFIKNCRIGDIASLRNLQIEKLCLSNTNIKDFTPLSTMNLKYLDISNTDFSDLTILLNSKNSLEVLNIANTKITNFTPLMKLKKIKILLIDKEMTKKFGGFIEKQTQIKKIKIIN